MVLAVNKSLEEDLALEMDLRQFAHFRVLEHITLHDEDLYAVNTEGAPDRIRPAADGDGRKEGETLVATLKHKSWNLIRLGKK